MEGYRSGHNGAVLKTVRGQPHKGSNPLPSATNNASKLAGLLAFIFLAVTTSAVDFSIVLLLILTTLFECCYDFS